MKIERSPEGGLCFGVSRAVKLLKEAASEYGAIEVLGAPVHNQWLVDHLSQVGVKVIGNLNQLNGKALAIGSHGISPQLIKEIQAHKIAIIDVTCPIVQQAQQRARELAERDFDVIIFGNPAHLEVKGILGWTEGKGIATLDAHINWDKPPRRLGILSQTTQIENHFTKFVSSLIASWLPQVEQLSIVNTICPVIKRRQSLAIDMAKRADLVIVVGGRNSANTQHLAELCSSLSVETHLIETAAELKEDWFKGKRHLGITSGTSTPEETIQEIIQRIEAML